jgi:tRNA-splicing ligase RtcB
MTVTLRQLSPFSWEIPRRGGMRVPGRVYVAHSQLDALSADKALEQVCNVAHLPGIVGASLAMPDIHWGYGFPIGGVAAVDAESGAVSPGGVGYDINCGCRVITTQLHVDDVRSHLHAIVAKLFATIPTGMGAGRAIPRLSPRELGELMTQGANWAVAQG